MNDTDFLKMLFDGYVNCYGKLRWHYQMTYSDATEEEIGHFRDLGLMLGYIPVREASRAGIKNPDLVWLHYPKKPGEESGQNSVAVFLHLERENTSKGALSCVTNPNNKLLCSAHRAGNGGYPKYLIGIFGWVTRQDWDTCVHFIKSHVDYVGRKVLLIGCIGVSQDKATDIEGLIWVNNMAHCRKGKFALDKSRDGFWSTYFTSDWAPCQCSPGTLRADDPVSASGESSDDR